MTTSLFLEGLKSAREIIQNKGIEKLDELIFELDFEKKERENASATPEAETR
jgi:hypothetical protein